MVYALLVDGMDSKERERFDADLHGHSDKDKRALADLFGMPAAPSGGER
jgi:hypothetical protein